MAPMVLTMQTGSSPIANRYQIVKKLGGGGQKTVYLAQDLRLNRRPCALAEMIDSFADAAEQQQAIAAFQREADLLAGLKDEHIPQIYDKFSEGQNHYLVMEYIEGDTLENRLRAAHGALPDWK
jgi:serine/threonine protein kinase